MVTTDPSLQTSYGFISCCERNESIFFHYSQFTGDTENIQVGEEVEFEVDTDSLKGKLIARRIVSLPAGTVSYESVSQERYVGKVDQVPTLVRCYDHHRVGKRSGSISSDPGVGRIIYEKNGEVFYISYGFTDFNDQREIGCGDEVSFYMSTDKRWVSPSVMVLLIRTW
jgi:cold shock CspA family protein